MLRHKILIVLLAAFTIGLISCSESADDVMTKAIKARGDLEGQKAIKTVTAEIKSVNFGFDISMKMIISLPDKIRMDMNLLGKEITTVINGDNGWMVSDTMLKMMPPEQLVDNKRAIQSQMNFFRSELINDREKSMKTTLLGKDTLEGKKVIKVRMVSKDSVEKTIYVDADSYLQLKTEESSKFHGVKNVSEVIYRNYKQVQGFMVPHQIELKQNGAPTGKMTIGNLQFNAPVNDRLFVMPVK